MNRSATFPRGLETRRGYTLAEVIIAVVVLGTLLAPLVRSLVLIPRVSHSMAAQSRREAWRSAADQIATAGLDPERAPLFLSLLPSLSPADRLVLPDPAVAHVRDGERQAAVRVTWLSTRYTGAAEPRAVPAGIEVGASTAAALPRQDPLPPLPPRKLSPPVIRAPDSPLVRLDELRPGDVLGAPWVATIVAEGSDVVRLRQRAPEVLDVSGAGRAGLQVDAVQLAAAVRGEAWTEYAGDPDTDLAVPLEGGRLRWLVRQGRQFGVVEPSDPIAFVFGLNLGRPVFVYGGRTYASGERVHVDRSGARRVERREERAAMDYPADVQRVFGGAWGSVRPTFRWSLGTWPGDSSSGDTRSAFVTDILLRWGAEQSLHAEPQTHLAGLSLWSGYWTLERRTTALQPPERTGDYYDAGLDAPGMVAFAAPIAGDEGRLGRPEIGGVESVTENLSVILLP